MNQRKIHIENLQIRLPRGSATDARQMVNGLGDEILRQTTGLTSRKAGTRRIEKLDVGKIKVSGGTSSSDLQKRIARQIAAIIGESIK